jgi:putative toxin-antitoxin system antitoxin component (TIGR02293 family)
MKHKSLNIKPFSTKESIDKASESMGDSPIWVIKDAEGRVYQWANNMQRVNVIRQGISYGYIEKLSERLNRPVKTILSLVGIPQTTYNKKKSEHALLDSRDSELIVLLTELIDYGILVFNHEEDKFQRWLKKPNLSLGGNSPESLLDTTTGIDEVKYCLNRIEFGNFS